MDSIIDYQNWTILTIHLKLLDCQNLVDSITDYQIENILSQQLTPNSDYDEWLLAKAGTIVWPFSVLKSVLFNDGLPGQI